MELSGRVLFLNQDYYPLRRYVGERMEQIGRLARRHARKMTGSARVAEDLPQLRSLVERSKGKAGRRSPDARQDTRQDDSPDQQEANDRVTVLVLALDAYNGRVYHDMLEVRGYYPVTAVNVDGWLDVLDDCNPDLILVDLCSSDHPSIDVARTIMNDQRYRTVPIVLITDAYKSGDLSDPSTIIADCDGRITKPISVDGFYRPIEEILNRTTGQRRIRR